MDMTTASLKVDLRALEKEMRALTERIAALESELLTVNNLLVMAPTPQPVTATYEHAGLTLDGA